MRTSVPLLRATHRSRGSAFLDAYLPWLGFAGPFRKLRGPHRDLRVALIADDLTRACMEQECIVFNLTPANGRSLLHKRRPDLLFVESAWGGLRNSWKFGIASYPDYPERNNRHLADLVATAKELGIPAVFWNKEDDVHFDRFIASAALFDHIFTVDERCVPRYRQAIDREVTVAPLMFAVAPTFHHVEPIAADRSGACFVGSYGWHVHDRRRERQDMLLEAAARTLGLVVYDRNSNRRSSNYRYPPWPRTEVRGKVPYHRTAEVYRKHLVSLNVNTIEDSETMFSRRLVEVIASGGLAVSTPARSIDRWFKDYCHVVENEDEVLDLFSRLARDGYSSLDRQMMSGGADYVLKHHTYTQRIDTLLETIQLGRSLPQPQWEPR